MITELNISHYKSISELSIKLGRANVFVGKNGSGKSNILDALYFLNDVVSEDLDYAMTRRHGADSIRQWSKFKPLRVTIEVGVETSQGKGSYKLVFSSSRNSYRIQEESGKWEGNHYLEDNEIYSSSFTRLADGAVEVKSNYPEFGEVSDLRLSSADCAATHAINTPYSDFGVTFAYLFRELSGFSTFVIFPNTVRSPQTISRAKQLESDGKNIASILKQMAGRPRDRLVKALQAVMPILTSISVRSTAGFYVPVFSVTEPSGEVHELNMSQISDGTLRILGMLTAFYQPRAPQKIAVEEPEQMIHPGLLIVVYDAVREFLRNKLGGQVFITTHSPIFIDMFDVSEVLAVEFANGNTVCGPVSKRQLEVVKDGLMSLGEVLLSEDLQIDLGLDR